MLLITALAWSSISAELRPKEPVLLVGHSMGCLVAVRVARQRPDLARHLILYEMPLYEGLPDKRRYRLRLNFYFSLYERIIQYKPGFNVQKARMIERIIGRLDGFQMTEETWTPFIRSLKNTIMQQTASDDIKHIRVPMEVIYGSRDRLVIRGKTQLIFGEDTENITSHVIKERHSISSTASLFLAERIEAVYANKPAQ